MPAKDPSALELRVAQLELAHRRLRRLTGAMLALLIAATSLGMADRVPPETVVAKSLQLLDENGKLRVLINARAGVSLFDEQSRPRAVLSLDQEGPGLALYGTSSRVGTILNVNQDGPVLAMRDNGGHTRILLTALDQGPAFILSDEHERERVTVIQRAGEASMGVLNGYGTFTWKTP